MAVFGTSSVLGPVIGGLLVGMALSPTGLIMIASQVKRIAAALSDVPWWKKLLMALGGIILLTSFGQLVITTAVMLAYSWRLTAL